VSRVEPLLFEHGFSKVTTDEIADHLGISKKTLYQEFSSKSELVRAVVHAKMARIDDTMADLASAVRAGEAEPISAHLWNVGRELHSLRRPFVADLNKHDPDLWEEIRAFRRERVFGRLQELITDGQRNGLVREDLSPLVIVEIVIAVADTLITPAKMIDIQVAPHDLIDHVASILSEGILTARGRERRQTHG
jgi:AcrR family transcriptional regulator